MNFKKVLSFSNFFEKNLKIFKILIIILKMCELQLYHYLGADPS